MYRCRRIAFASIILASAAPAHAGRDDWDEASNVAYVLIVTSIGAPAIEGDREGAVRAAGAYGASWAVTEVLKRTVQEQRPDESDNRSFPSGHASGSFAAAATLHKRYGWQIGVPAHAVASFVAVARVKARKYDVQDVIAGAAIGEIAGWTIGERKDSKVQWVPWGDTKGGGIAVTMRF